MTRPRRQILRRILGTTILATLSLLLINSYLSDRIDRAKNSYPLYADFFDIQGLKVGDPATLAGKTIGKVTQITLNPESLAIRITLAIDNSIAIPSDSAAIIRGQGLSEQKELILEPGAEETSLSSGESFQFTRDPIELPQLIETLVLRAEKKIRQRSSEKTQPRSP